MFPRSFGSFGTDSDRVGSRLINLIKVEVGLNIGGIELFNRRAGTRNAYLRAA